MRSVLCNAAEECDDPMSPHPATAGHCSLPAGHYQERHLRNSEETCVPQLGVKNQSYQLRKGVKAQPCQQRKVQREAERRTERS